MASYLLNIRLLRKFYFKHCRIFFIGFHSGEYEAETEDLCYLELQPPAGLMPNRTIQYDNRLHARRHVAAGPKRKPVHRVGVTAGRIRQLQFVAPDKPR